MPLALPRQKLVSRCAKGHPSAEFPSILLARSFPGHPRLRHDLLVGLVGTQELGRLRCTKKKDKCSSRIGQHDRPRRPKPTKNYANKPRPQLLKRKTSTWGVMVDSSAPTSDEGESRRRLSSTKSFLSHLHENHGAKRVGGRAHQPATIDANSSDVVSAGDHPLVPSRKGAVAASRRGSLVSFGHVEVQGDDDANARRTGRQAARGDDKSSLSSCAASNDAVAHLSERRDVPPRRTPSLTPPNEAVPDGEFTFRCSSTMMPLSPNSRSSLPGIDLVGTIICAQNESPVSSISSHRFSGKRCAYGLCLQMPKGGLAQPLPDGYLLLELSSRKKVGVPSSSAAIVVLGSQILYVQPSSVVSGIFESTQLSYGVQNVC